ncbi:hypothetical protein ACLIBG_00520 [Virgibacillus sp. W0181]|uniref:hypothetical protein n=1 Tax=Virgibacillus sp. W0181 TaxID=3391581 RepID=UPI003F476B87
MKFVTRKNLPLVEEAPIEDFCTDHRCCPDRFPTAEFPSPTSCLSIDELEELEKEIAVANELLLDLALDNRPPEETFRKALFGLEGLFVEVKLLTGQTVEGKVHTAGFDFVVLLDDKMETILPYRVIGKVEPKGRFAEHEHEAQLRDIDPCLRRDITSFFGATVASSPKLLHLFFRMRLNIYLLFLETKTIEITMDDEVIKGFVTDVNKETIVLKVEKDVKIISMEKIIMISIKKEN